MPLETLEVDRQLEQIGSKSFTTLLFVEHSGHVLTLAFANIILYPLLLPHTIVLLLLTWQGLWRRVTGDTWLLESPVTLLELICCGLSLWLTSMTTLVWWRLCLAATAGYALAHGVHITGSLLMLKFGKVGVRPVLLFGSVWWMASHASAWLRLLLAIGGCGRGGEEL